MKRRSEQNDPINAATARRISPDQSAYFSGYRVDRRLYSKIPIRSCDIVRRGNDLLETGVEKGLGDSVFVALESLEQSGVCSSGVDCLSVLHC